MQKKESSVEKSLHKKKNAFSREGKSHRMIQEYFKVSDTDESVLDLNELLKVELKNDNVQSFNTRWEQTIIAMKKQPDDEIVENFLNYRQLQQSRQLKPVTVSVH